MTDKVRAKKHLGQHFLKDEDVAFWGQKNSFALMGIALMSPLAIIGEIINVLPLFTAKKLTKSLIPNDLPFEIPVKICMAMVFYPLYLMLILGTLLLMHWHWLWVLMVPLLGYIWIKWRAQYPYLRSFFKRLKIEKNQFAGLQQQREKLLSELR